MRIWRVVALLIVGGFSARVKDPGKDPSDWRAVKIVVNSNRKYQLPLKMLLDSMRAIKFQNLTDVIIVIGGADSEKIYREDGLTYIETGFMNFDLTGLSMLWHYKDHPFVQAHAYLYTLDTTTVGIGFQQKFNALASLNYDDYVGFERPASNICAFGRGVLEKFHQNFERKLSKYEGMLYEFGYEPQGVKLLQDLAENVTVLPRRRDHGDPVDLYRTGHARHAFWYADFEIFKYIFIGHFGDFDQQMGDLHAPPLAKRFQ